MTTTVIAYISKDELCQVTGIQIETLIELVEYGIAEPCGDIQEDWVFEVCIADVVKRANRLHRDLDIDWAGVALVLDLLDELKQLKADNKMLKQRLSRFM